MLEASLERVLRSLRAAEVAGQRVRIRSAASRAEGTEPTRTTGLGECAVRARESLGPGTGETGNAEAVAQAHGDADAETAVLLGLCCLVYSTHWDVLAFKMS